MAVKADMRYEAKVRKAFLGQSKNSNTPAIFMRLETEDGVIDHNIYVTPKTVERVKETLYDCFGLTPEQVVHMVDSNDWSKIIDDIVSITTIAEEYNGKEQVKVQWLNPAGFQPKKAEPVNVKYVSDLFSGKAGTSAAAPVPNWSAPLDESNDVPF